MPLMLKKFMTRWYSLRGCCIDCVKKGHSLFCQMEHRGDLGDWASPLFEDNLRVNESHTL